MLSVLQAVKRYFAALEYKKGCLKGAGQDGSREWVTTIASICQDGTALPPTVIWAAVKNNIHNVWVEKVIIRD